MNKNIICSLFVMMGLSGCIVTQPQEYIYVPPAPVFVPSSQTTFIYEEGLVYPNYEAAYMLDVYLGCYFFFDRFGVRHNMPHGWNFKNHGVLSRYNSFTKHR